MSHTGFLHKGVILEPADFNGFDWIGTMGPLGLNTLGIHSGGGATSLNIPEKIALSLTPEFRDRVRKSGLQMEFELHAGAALLPRTLFASHPEYFPLSGPEQKRSDRNNWCSTDPEACRIVRENAAALAKILKPDTHRYLFWGDDTASGWCRCPRCRDFSDSDQALMAANSILEGIRSSDPAAEVPYLAYQNALQVPRLVKPAPGIFLEFAPFHRCWEHAICDPACEKNREQWQALLDLLQLFPPEKTHILEYFLDSSLASGWKKPAKKVLFSRKIAEADIAAYHGLGIRSITTFAVYMDGEYFRNYGDRELKEYAELLGKYD